MFSFLNRDKLGKLTFNAPHSKKEIRCELYKVKNVENAFRINNTNIYIHASLVQKGKDGYKLLRHHEKLSILLNEWNSDNLVWYRGMPGCHWKWSCLQNNIPIHSEGYDEFPQYTMGDEQREKRTRWLPGEMDRDVCEVAAVQCLADVEPPSEIKKYVPVGGIMCVKIGQKTNAHVCIMPGSEIQLRGPALAGDYEPQSIVILRNFEEHTNMLFTCPNSQLPNARPFFDELNDTPEITAIKEQQLKEWYKHVEEWQLTVLPTLTPCNLFNPYPSETGEAAADTPANSLPAADLEANEELLMSREKQSRYKAVVAERPAPAPSPAPDPNAEVKEDSTMTPGKNK